MYLIKIKAINDQGCFEGRLFGQQLYEVLKPVVWLKKLEGFHIHEQHDLPPPPTASPRRPELTTPSNHSNETTSSDNDNGCGINSALPALSQLPQQPTYSTHVESLEDLFVPWAWTGLLMLAMQLAPPHPQSL